MAAGQFEPWPAIHRGHRCIFSDISLDLPGELVALLVRTGAWNLIRTYGNVYFFYMCFYEIYLVFFVGIVYYIHCSLSNC